MLRLLDNPADAHVLAPLIEREILRRLLTGPHGGMVRQIGLADSGLSHVSRAIRWIRDNYAEPRPARTPPGSARTATRRPRRARMTSGTCPDPRPADPRRLTCARPTRAGASLPVKAG